MVPKHLDPVAELTILDLFAGLCMARLAEPARPEESDPKALAKRAYELAEALVAERDLRLEAQAEAFSE